MHVVFSAMISSLGHLNVANGGKNGYTRVRGGQGPNQDKWQGYIKGKKKTTSLYDTAEEAAVALAQLEQDIALGLVDVDDKKPRKSRKTSGAPTPTSPARPSFDRPPSDRLFRLSSQPRPSCPSRTRRRCASCPRSFLRPSCLSPRRRCPRCTRRSGPRPQRQPRSAFGPCRPSSRLPPSRTRASRCVR